MALTSDREQRVGRLRKALVPFGGCWSWGVDVGWDDVCELENAARGALDVIHALSDHLDAVDGERGDGRAQATRSFRLDFEEEDELACVIQEIADWLAPEAGAAITLVYGPTRVEIIAHVPTGARPSDRSPASEPTGTSQSEEVENLADWLERFACEVIDMSADELEKRSSTDDAVAALRAARGVTGDG